jgi:hypothetical protein
MFQEPCGLLAHASAVCSVMLDKPQQRAYLRDVHARRRIDPNLAQSLAMRAELIRRVGVAEFMLQKQNDGVEQVFLIDCTICSLVRSSSANGSVSDSASSRPFRRMDGRSPARHRNIEMQAIGMLEDGRRLRSIRILAILE